MPKAFLNYILFDKDFSNPTFGFIQVSSSAESTFEKLTLQKDIDEEGYRYIYVSNESSLNSNVYFDDLTVTHGHSPVVQVNAYYPFGLAMEGLGYDRGAAAANLYGFNGMEQNNEVGLYNTTFRMYNPGLGRFNGVDPAASLLASYSPYHFSFNNPISFSDPSGAMPPQHGPGYLDEIEYGEDYYNAVFGEDSRPAYEKYGWESGVQGSNNHWSDRYVHSGGPSHEQWKRQQSAKEAVKLLGGSLGDDNIIRWYESTGQGYYSDKDNLAGGWLIHPYAFDLSSWLYVDHVDVWASSQGGNGLTTGAPGWAEKTNTGVGAFGFAHGGKEQLFDFAAKTDDALKQTKYVKAVKVASKGIFAAQAGYSVYQTGHAFYTGNENKWGVAGKSGLDITMGAVAVWGGPIGWGVAGVYFIGDVAGWWGDWGELE